MSPEYTQIGGGDSNLVESEEPLTVKMSIKAFWKKGQIDLAELARLRYIEKWSCERLARHFHTGKDKVRKYIQQLAAKGLM